MDSPESATNQALILPACIFWLRYSAATAANHRRFLRKRVRINSAHNLFFRLQNRQLEITLYI